MQRSAGYFGSDSVAAGLSAAVAFDFRGLRSRCVSAHPTECIETGIDASYFGVLETFDAPWHLKVGSDRILLARGLSFLTQKSGDDLGWELDLWVKYHYSADLIFEAGWSHLFTGAGLADGNFNDMNGLLFNGGPGTGDADYVYFQTTLKF